jgi:Domain of unknown function (DUF4386)
MSSTRKTARVAGLLYLLLVITGPFLLFYVPGKLYVSGDAGATAANILAHPSLYRIYIAVGIVATLLFVAVVLALYRLLRGVGPELAAVMVILVLIQTPLATLGVANEAATLEVLGSPDALSVFDPPQRDVVATLLIQFDQRGVAVSEVFWGLWLLPLGMLVYRSRFLPRLLGVWLFVNGLAYLVLSATGLLAPRHLGAVTRIATPVLFGEVALMLWLLLVGARTPPPVETAPAGG